AARRPGRRGLRPPARRGDRQSRAPTGARGHRL
ncbi:MAG: hypothetical protein AVDCRST_MAG79-2019, partial [uncultured Thermoleophilia bacterium]